MADRHADQYRNINQQDHEPDKSYRLISERIVRQPLPRHQTVRKIPLIISCVVLFGVLLAIRFVVGRPMAECLLSQEIPEESSQVTIPKNDPEITQTTTAGESSKTEPTQTESMDEMVRSEMEGHRYSINDLNKLYNNPHAIAVNVDNGLMAVHSIQCEKDRFDNPIEILGQFSGATIAGARVETLILALRRTVGAADPIEVAFPGNTMMPSTVKQSDTIAGLTVISVDVTQVNNEQFKKVEAIELGNSYSVKQGGLVVAVGVPAGVVHSSDHGNISYVMRNVQIMGGTSRFLYIDVNGDADAGILLANASGELIGQVTDQHGDEDPGRMTTAVAMPDYKGILSVLTDGISAPYFGIKGQEVDQIMEDSGIPYGIYVTVSTTDEPAYSAGIQAGDITTRMDGEQMDDMKDFQNQMGKLYVGDGIKVVALRNRKDEYKGIEFPIAIGAR